MQLILSILLISSSTFSYKKTGNRYAFFYPRVLSSMQPTKFCLLITENLLPAKVHMELVTVEQSCGKNVHTINSGYSCWQLIVPEILINEQENATIKIMVETRDKSITFRGKELISIYPNEKHSFIETDKKVYKLGDIVKIRYFIVGSDLKPIENFKIPYLKVINPRKDIEIQWNSVTTKLGLAQLEFHLPENAYQGEWHIKSKENSVSIKVEVHEAHMGKFHTTITGPNIIHLGNRVLSNKICAAYSYGKHVEGTASLTTEAVGSIPKEFPDRIYQEEKLKHGCANFDILLEDLSLKTEQELLQSIKLDGEVREKGTNLFGTVTRNIPINKEPYSYLWKINEYFKPQLPTKGTFSITNEISNANFTIHLCYMLNTGRSLICETFDTNSENSIEFTIPPITVKSATAELIVEAKILNGYVPFNTKLNILQWYSGTNRAIKIENISKNPHDCESSALEFFITYNSEDIAEDKQINFQYILLSRLQILKVGNVIHTTKKDKINFDDYPNVIGKSNLENINNKLDKFNLKINLKTNIYAKSLLIVYYIHKNEVISDDYEIEVTECTENKVKAKWAVNSLYPGEMATLHFEAQPHSLCAVSFVDQAITVLGTNGPHTVSNILKSFNRKTFPHIKQCKGRSKDVDVNPGSSSFIEHTSSLRDSQDVFLENNIGIISNYRFLSKVCKKINHPSNLFMSYGTNKKTFQDGDKLITDWGSTVRSYFPDTWLWDLITVEDSGQVVLKKKVPDTITKWIGSILCMSSSKGLGLKNNIEINVFKPFFLDIVLPHSIKRNEQILDLFVPIFNYLNYSLPIRILLEKNEGLNLVDGENANKLDICLQADDSYTHTFRIKGIKLGLFNVTVKATIDSEYIKNCTKSVATHREIVQKPLLVVPEGDLRYLSKTDLLCASDTLRDDKIDWNLVLPSYALVDTIKGKLIINPNVLEPIPEIMVLMSKEPYDVNSWIVNIYALKYLKSCNKLTDNVEAEILKNLEIGYQRVLHFFDEDGFFFTEDQSTMFLTALAIRALEEVKEYIFVEEGITSNATQWIISHQLTETGCFDPVNYISNSEPMNLANEKGNYAPMTSHVIISLLEVNTDLDKIILSNAAKCIMNDKSSDVYATIINTYALSLIDSSQDIQYKLQKLLEMSNKEDTEMWWAETDSETLYNVEVTSYALKLLLKYETIENIKAANLVVKWLQHKLGKFKDEILYSWAKGVAFDSISQYATLIKTKRQDVTVSIKTKEDSKDIKVTKLNKTKIEAIFLQTFPNKITAKIIGDGCVAIEALIKYHAKIEDYLEHIESNSMKLEFKMQPIREQVGCSLVELKPCISYESSNKLAIAEVQVGIPPGFTVNQDSLEKLIDSDVVDDFIQHKNRITLFVLNLGLEEVCVPLVVERTLVVKSTTPEVVRLLDPHNPKVFTSKAFSIENCEQSDTKPIIPLMG